jgi:predicted RNA binding protein YcfA (HicA-like mRNA interferase family)
MPKLYSSHHIIHVLESHGFTFVSQRGSHTKYRKIEESIVTRTVVIPSPRKEIPIGTFRSIVRQAGLSPEDFL